MEQAGLVPTMVELFVHRGFDVLEVVDAGSRAVAELVDDCSRPLQAVGKVLLLADVNPLPGDLVKGRVPPGTASNPRLLTAVPKVERLLRAQEVEGSRVPPQHLLAFLDPRQDGWALVRRLAGPGREQEHRARVRELEDWLTPPFPVVTELSDWGITSRTDLVEYGGGLAVCKTFKQGREWAFRNELSCYALADRVDVIPDALLTGRNWVLVPYLADHVTVDVAFPRRIPVGLASACIAGYQRISDLGIALLDFGPKNVLVARDGRLAFIDFEHVHAYRDGRVRSPTETPLALDRSFSDGDGPSHAVDVLKSYDRHWLPTTGVPLTALVDQDLWPLHVRQLAFFGRRAVARRARRLRARVVF